ncbi:Vacuolar protein sorting-associated protein 54, chloroplastic [Erysiphe neolycopersici]|uniref:Vacuolar protein sorting-associated protein 54 n=1 Tax=Erysiphe neolycopersici TaxID=212602 RepID=A0A420I1B7_9PEZI|nr:Vacuolar protein sorting-associated protein 54, chloroplastic [Erysiphe neolycopersici]
MQSPSSRRSVDSLSPTSPKTIRSEFYPRAGVGGRFQTQRGSVAGSPNNFGSKLDAAANWHGLAESGQNSIFTLLQSPIVRSGSIVPNSILASNAFKAPTIRDIPPVTLSPIPDYDATVLKPYLSQVGALYGALHSVKEVEEEDGAQSSKKSCRSESGTESLDQIMRLSGSVRSNSSRLSSTSSSIEAPRKRSAGARRAVLTTAPLTTIPSVFFEEDFHLENPRTFDVVSERSELVRPVQTIANGQRSLSTNDTAPRKALASNAILQEKLSWYMDTIEIHLVNSISSASKSFFAALSSLRELHMETSISVNRIKTLRKDLLSLDEEMAVSGLKIVSMKQRRENLKQLSDTILQLQSIMESIKNCESLIEDGDVEKALDSIDSLESLVSGDNKSNSNHIPARDLREAGALKNLTNNIDELRHRIGRVFELRFQNLLMGDLKQYMESISMSNTLQRWNLSSQRSRGHHREHSSPPYVTVKAELRSALFTVLTGLYRARHISPAIIVYRESVLREVRNIARRQLPASSDEDTESVTSASTVGISKPRTQQEKISILARNLRSMEPEEGEDLLKRIYIGIGETLRRIATHGKVLLDITSTIGENISPTNSPQSPVIGPFDERLSKTPSRIISSRDTQEEIHLSLNISDLVGQAVDTAQDKIIKLLRVRSEQTIRLSVDNFLRYFTLNLLFANECEAVSGRSGTLLKNLVNGHIKDFTRQLGESQRQSLATGMEADTWNAKDFNEEDNEVLSCIISSGSQDVKAWTVDSYVWIKSPSETKLEDKINSSLEIETNVEKNQTTPTPSKAVIRPAIIESETFILPTSATLCLHGLASFLHLNTGIPSMTSEIASSILSYLALFNSRCTQLILGAGATRSAGLKNITTKHLALASQALSFISILIPHIREFVRRHCSSLSPNATLINEFDKIKKVYLEHQKSISDKLVEIMAGRTMAHTKSMRSIDWSKERDGVNNYMETLTKETNTLYRVLSKHLPEATVNKIMQSVLANYKEQWSKAFGEVSLVSEKAKERMLRDVEWFKDKLAYLDNVVTADDTNTINSNNNDDINKKNNDDDSNNVGASLIKLVKEKEVILKSISVVVPALNKISRQPSIFDLARGLKKEDESKTEDENLKVGE